MRSLNKKGFTLIEALISIVLLGMAIAALMVSNGALTNANGAGIEISTAEFLVEQIREMTASLPVRDPQTGAGFFGNEEGSLSLYDDTDDFNGKTYSPPIDSSRAQLTAFSSYTQQITVENVSESNLSTHANNHSTDFYRVTVKVLLNGKELSRASWLRARF